MKAPPLLLQKGRIKDRWPLYAPGQRENRFGYEVVKIALNDMERRVELLINLFFLAGLETQHLTEPSIPRYLALMVYGVIYPVEPRSLPSLAAAVFPEGAGSAIPVCAALQDIQNAPLKNAITALRRIVNDPVHQAVSFVYGAINVSTGIDADGG